MTYDHRRRTSFSSFGARSLLLLLFTLIFFVFWGASIALGEPVTLPGSDNFSKLTAAGDLIRIIDSFIFKFGARLLAGLTVLAAGWNLKEQRFAMAIICIFAAILMATVPMWVKNIFDIGGGTIFKPGG